ncbi:hypothetical protein BFP76_01085 [Amylibacter kogurei]|uniref:Carbohydrate kinase PfkB domain-containing protein n=2 Tax=Paramylibacter kogurei TaxID=1889778 RepID=A0A2G5K978_9RHOB|nr:hypothetical protein BFP76_01085 [Amylibacter kogurei]
MILCCGEALIDMVPSDVNGQTSYTPLNGGAVYNTAIALSRLGVNTGFLSGLSTDLFGAQLNRILLHENVDTSYCVRSNQPTTLAFVQLTNGHAQYTFYDENSAGRLLSPRDVPAIPATVQAMFFGGISLCNDPAGNTYEQVCVANAAKKVIMIDPNIRPSFIDDTAQYLNRIDNMISHADIVKLSDEDLDWIATARETPVDPMDVIHEFGSKIVLITKGSKGSVAHLPSGATVDMHPPAINVVDTIGAGDTFNAGFLSVLHSLGLLTKEKIAKIDANDIHKALDYASKAAAIAVSRSGANPPTKAELEQQFHQITVDA